LCLAIIGPNGVRDKRCASKPLTAFIRKIKEFIVENVPMPNNGIDVLFIVLLVPNRSARLIHKRFTSKHFILLCMLT
jgi:hypothetical protein